MGCGSMERTSVFIECNQPTMCQTMEKLSVYVDGEQEALRFKWIESERAGKDLGEAAIRAWVKQHWWGFLRARWVEHLQGRRLRHTARFRRWRADRDPSSCTYDQLEVAVPALLSDVFGAGK